MKKYMIIILLLPSAAFAQYENEDEVLDYLSGNEYKLWFFIRYDTNMGGNDTCETGKAYTFNRSKTIEIKECIDGKWVRDEYKYTLEKESPYDWWIRFNNNRYYLVMLDRGGYLEAKLRTIGSLHDKTDKTEAIILKHYLDD